MKVILTESIESLGQAGEVKDVANGYARNYLLPRGLAAPATAGALKQLERQRAMIERKAATRADEARSMAERINATEVVVYAKSGEQSRLYGSVTTSDVADALKAQHGIEIDRRNISIDEAIHRLGNYHATVKLNAGQSGKLTLVVDSEENRGKPRPQKAAEIASPTAEIASPTAEIASLPAEIVSLPAEVTASPAERDLPVMVVELPATVASGETSEETL